MTKSRYSDDSSPVMNEVSYEVSLGYACRISFSMSSFERALPVDVGLVGDIGAQLSPGNSANSWPAAALGSSPVVYMSFLLETARASSASVHPSDQMSEAKSYCGSSRTTSGARYQRVPICTVRLRFFVRA
mgnify:FL=1|jgi:hypothetical protein